MAAYTLDDICWLYEEYLGNAGQLEQNRKPFEVLLGLNSGSPCHDGFAKELERLLDAISAQRRDSGSIKEILDYIYRMPLTKPQPASAYWMLLAVHGLTLGLIDQLNQADAETMWQQYKRDYPRRDRLPPQEAVLSKLKIKCRSGPADVHWRGRQREKSNK